MNAWTMLAIDFMLFCGFICVILIVTGKDRK